MTQQRAQSLRERVEEAIWVVFFRGLPYGWKQRRRPTMMEGFKSRLQTGRASKCPGDQGYGNLPFDSGDLTR